MPLHSLSLRKRSSNSHLYCFNDRIWISLSLLILCSSLFFSGCLSVLWSDQSAQVLESTFPKGLSLNDTLALPFTVNCAVFDPTSLIAFLGTTNGLVFRVNCSDDALVLLDNINVSKQLNTSVSLVASVIDITNDVAYFVAPAISENNYFYVFKISLNPFRCLSIVSLNGYGYQSIPSFLFDSNASMLIVFGNSASSNSLTLVPTDLIENNCTSITKLDNNEYTFVETIKNVSDKTPISTAFVDSVHGFIYAIVPFSNVSQILQISLNEPNVTIFTTNLTIGKAQGVLYDERKEMAYIFNNEPDTINSILKFNTRNLTSSDILYLGPNIHQVYVGVIDTVGGQAYLGCFMSNTVLFQVNLSSFSVPNFGELVGTSLSGLANAAFLDAANDFVYFITHLNGSSVSTLARILVPPPCLNNCTDRGSCYYSTCDCTANLTAADRNLFPYSPGYGGVDCTEVLCYQNCNQRGPCENGICTCGLDYTGVGCQIRTCPNSCSGHGTCNISSYICTCFPGWMESDCSVVVSKPCYALEDCSSCMKNNSCGWCMETESCLEGDINGPSYGGCSSWYIQLCPTSAIGVEFFAYLMSFIAGLLLLIDMISAFREDKNMSSQKPTDAEIRSSWWRNQRSAKTWTLIEQIQFAAITSQFAINIPSLYFNFVSIYRWAIFGFPLPWSENSAPSGSRALMNFDQYSSSILAYPDQVFFGSLFWLGILLCVIFVFFLIVYVVNHIFFENNSNIHRFVVNRVVYSLVRLEMFAYFPFAVTATHAIVLFNQFVISAIVAAILLLVLHLGFLTTIFFISPKNRDTTRLFAPHILKKFGCLYNSFYVKKIWYIDVILLKRLIFGVVVGALSSQPIIQLSILLGIQVLYLIPLFVVKPYLDHIQTFLDACCAIGNAFVIAFLFAFLNGVLSPSDFTLSLVFSVLASVFVMVTQLICVGAFLHNWLRLENIRTWNDFVARVKGRDLSIDNIDLELDIPTQKRD